MKAMETPKGFTLIELLVVTAVIGMLAIMSATVFNTILSAQNKTTITNEVRQNGNIVIDRFDRDVKQSSSMTQVGTQGVDLTTNAGVVQWRCLESSTPPLTIQRDGVNIINVEDISGVQLVSTTCSFNVIGTQTQIVKFDFDLEERRVTNGNSQFELRVPFEVTVGTR